MDQGGHIQKFKPDNEIQTRWYQHQQNGIYTDIIVVPINGSAHQI
jgi:hypothetical protein